MKKRLAHHTRKITPAHADMLPCFVAVLFEGGWVGLAGKIVIATVACIVIGYVHTKG